MARLWFCDSCGVSIPERELRQARRGEKVLCSECRGPADRTTLRGSSRQNTKRPWATISVVAICVLAAAGFAVVALRNPSATEREVSRKEASQRVEPARPAWPAPERIQEIIGIESPSGFDIYVCLTDGHQFTAADGTLTVTLNNADREDDHGDGGEYRPKTWKVTQANFQKYEMTQGAATRSIFGVRVFVSDEEDLTLWRFLSAGYLHCWAKFETGGSVLKGVDRVYFRRPRSPRW